MRYCPWLAPLRCVMFLLECKVCSMALLCRVLHFYRLIEVLRPLCIFTEWFTWQFHCYTNDKLGQQGMAILTLSWSVLLWKIYSLISSVGQWMQAVLLSITWPSTSPIAELHSTAAIQSPYTWQKGKSNRLAFKVTNKRQRCTFIFFPDRSSEGKKILLQRKFFSHLRISLLSDFK